MSTSTGNDSLHFTVRADDPASVENALKMIVEFFGRRINELDRQVAALRLVPRLLATLEKNPEISGALAAAPVGLVLRVITDCADTWAECGGDFEEAAAKFAGEVKAKLKIATVDGVPVGDESAGT